MGEIYSRLKNQITKTGTKIVALQSGMEVMIGMMSSVAQMGEWKVTRANTVNNILIKFLKILSEINEYKVVIDFFAQRFKPRFNLISLDDECAKHSDNCDTNAKCTDTIFSFSCECNDGYEGTGVNCEGTFKLF